MTHSHRVLGLAWATGLLLAGTALIGLASTAAGQHVRIRTELGFAGQLPSRGVCPLTVLLENGTPDEVELELAVLASRSIGTAELVSRRVAVSARTARQVTVLIPAREYFECALEVASRVERSFVVMRGGAEGEPESRRRLRIPLDVRPGPLERPVVVLGGRGQQVVSQLPPILYQPDERNPLDADVELSLRGRRADTGRLEERFAPDCSLAYEGSSALLWTEPDPDQMTNPAQLAAIVRWVERGGYLVILAASRPHLLAHPDLAPLLPGAVAGVSEITYDAAGIAGPWLSLRPRPDARSSRPGTPTSFEGRPVRWERSLGQGTVVLATVDPLRLDTGDAVRFTGAMREATGLALAYRPLATNDWRMGPETASQQLFLDLTNRNVLRPPYGLFILLGFLFVLLIGPIDYVILKRRGKLAWSPVTLLVYTLVFTGASIGATFFLFAPAEEISRIAVVDFFTDDAGGERVAGRTYHGIYAPYGGEFVPVLEEAEQFGTPLVTSEWGMGGGILDATQRFLGPGRQPITLDLPFNSFRAAETLFDRVATASVTAGFDGVGASASLHVVNGLAAALENVRFVTADDAAVLPDVPPGGALAVPRSEFQFVDGGLQRSSDPLPRLRAAGLSPTTTQLDGRPDQRQAPTSGMPAALRWLVYTSSVQTWLAALRPGERTERHYWSGMTDYIVLDEDAWDVSARLDRRHGLLLATTRTMPVADSLDDRSRGYAWTVVRRVVELPDR